MLLTMDVVCVCGVLLVMVTVIKKVTMCKVVMVIKLIDEVCDTVVILLVVLRLKDAFGSG